MISTQSNISLLSSTSELTLITLIMLLALFGWLAIRNRNIRSFEFQISMFIVVYFVGEIIEDYKLPFLSTFPYFGSQIHISSAVLLAVILWLRLYSVRKSGRNMIEKIEPVQEGSVGSGNENNSV